MNLPVFEEQIEVPHSNLQLVTVPIMQIDDMIVRILKAYTKAPVTAERVKTGKGLLIKNYCTLYGNSNLTLWRIAQLTDLKAYEIMCYRNGVSIH